MTLGKTLNITPGSVQRFSYLKYYLDGIRFPDKCLLRWLVGCWRTSVVMMINSHGVFSWYMHGHHAIFIIRAQCVYSRHYLCQELIKLSETPDVLLSWRVLLNAISLFCILKSFSTSDVREKTTSWCKTSLYLGYNGMDTNMSVWEGYILLEVISTTKDCVTFPDAWKTQSVKKKKKTANVTVLDRTTLHSTTTWI